MNMVRYGLNKDGQIEADVHQIDGSFPLVAPMTISASLLSANYGEFVKAVVPGVMVTNIQLDC
jgi:hypothetical protein|nr:hypothetical protein [bacterium]